MNSMPALPKEMRLSSAADRARGLLVALVLAGYPLVAALASVVGLGASSAPSLAVRLITAGLAVALLLWQPVRFDLRARVLLVTWFGFWTLYLTRVLYDGFARTLILPWTGTEYLVYAIVFSILPVLGALRPLPVALGRSLLSFTVGVGGVALLLSSYGVYQTLSDPTALLSSRAGIEKLNPISLGMLAGSVLILLVCQWRESPPRRRSVGVACAALALAALGGLVLSGSKGPVLTVLVALLAYWLVPVSGRKLAQLTFALAVLLGAWLVTVIPESNDIALVSRFYDLLSGENTDQSNIERLLAFRAAWDQFIGSPLVGDALVENRLHYYPHNVFLEVAMSTGVPGLLCVVLLSALSLRRSLRALSAHEPYRWVHLLSLQYFLGALVSGGVHMASQFWFFLMFAYFVQTRSPAELAGIIQRTPQVKLPLAP